MERPGPTLVPTDLDLVQIADEHGVLWWVQVTRWEPTLVPYPDTTEAT